MANKPAVFVGSSQKGIDVANAFVSSLESDAEVTLWKDGFFELSNSTLGSLIDRALLFDFAVLIFTPDDPIHVGDAEHFAARDNVVFELGLFMGVLGQRRVFFVFNEDDKPKIPSDLAGVTAATYRKHVDGNLQAAIRPACVTIVNRLRAEGIRPRQLESTLRKLSDNARTGYRIPHRPLQDEVTFQCSELASMSTSWAEGQLRVAQRYQGVLAQVYELATKNIFSTSIPLYRNVWKSEAGYALLKLQQSNKNATSTRVFVFDRHDEVTDDDKKIFEQHRAHGIEVLLFFDEKWPLSFPASMGNDWTLVDDGEVIGVTLRTSDAYEAQWFFGNKVKGAQFCIQRDKLRLVSEKWAR